MQTSMAMRAAHAPAAAARGAKKARPPPPAARGGAWPRAARPPPPPPPTRPAATENVESLPSDAEVISYAALPAASSSYAGLRLLVVGAGGGTGAAVCAAAAAEGVPVTALVHDRPGAVADARAALPPGATVVAGDVARYASLLAAFQAAGDFNCVVWAVGSNSLSTFSRGVKEGGALGLARAVAAAVNPLAARAVELAGVENGLAALAATGRAADLKRFVLVSSIGADDPLAQAIFPGGVLLWKKRAEEVVQRAGLPYTIIRPGGLKTGPSPGGSAGLVMTGPNGIGFGPGAQARPGSISRAQVADVALAALVTDAADGKVVEVVSGAGSGGGATAVRLPWADLFGGAEQ